MSLRSKIVAYTDGSGVFWLIVSAIVLVALSYVYSVNRTVILVAERNDIESKIAAYRTDISNLESRYISERNAVTLELAQSLGYGEATDVVYMPKKAVSVLTQANTIQ
jgi:cell division protein FtsL